MSLLYFAMRRNDIDAVKKVLASGWNVHERKAGLTPLHYAALEGKSGIIEVLLEYGANTELLDSYGDTPLHDARVSKHKDVVSLLEKHEEKRIAALTKY